MSRASALMNRESLPGAYLLWMIVLFEDLLLGIAIFIAGILIGFFLGRITAKIAGLPNKQQ